LLVSTTSVEFGTTDRDRVTAGRSLHDPRAGGGKRIAPILLPTVAAVTNEWRITLR
jgi:hypothetical protein